MYILNLGMLDENLSLLAGEQRRLSRKKKGSNNRERQRVRADVDGETARVVEC